MILDDLIFEMAGLLTNHSFDGDFMKESVLIGLNFASNNENTTENKLLQINNINNYLFPF